MYFASLWSLILTVPATVLVGVLLRQSWLNYQASNNSYGERGLIAGSSRFLSLKLYAGFCGLVLLASGLVCIGMARPQRETDTASFPQGTMDVICLSDVSRSMAAQDYLGKTSGRPALAAGTRLDMVRQIILDKLIPSLASNRLAIVSVAGVAFDQAYLGDDYKALSWVIENHMLVGSATGEGADLEAGLAMVIHYIDVDAKLAARKSAEPQKERQRLLVVFSDGGFDAETAKFSQLLEELAKRRVKVLVVGMGGRNPAAIPVAQLGARDRYFYSGTSGRPFLVLDGQTVLTSRDQEALHKLAEKFKARYIPIDSLDDFQMEAEDFELVSQTRRSQEELFRLPVCLAFLAIFAGQLLLLAPVFSFKNKFKKAQADDESAAPGKE